MNHNINSEIVKLLLEGNNFVNFDSDEITVMINQNCFPCDELILFEDLKVVFIRICNKWTENSTQYLEWIRSGNLFCEMED